MPKPQRRWQRPARVSQSRALRAPCECNAWASRYGTVGIDPAVGDAERAFHHLCRHAKEAGQDHPEHGAGPPDRNGHGDSRDIAEPDRSGKSRAQRLEMGEVAGLVGTRVPAPHDLQRQAEIADTRKAEIQRENDPAVINQKATTGTSRPAILTEKKMTSAITPAIGDIASSICRSRFMRGIRSLDRGLFFQQHVSADLHKHLQDYSVSPYLGSERLRFPVYSVFGFWLHRIVVVRHGYRRLSR